RRGAGTGEIAGRLGHGDFGAFVRVQINVGGVAIHGHGDEFFQGGNARNGSGGERIVLEADDGDVGAGANHGAVAHHVVVLAIDPVFGGDGGPGEELAERGGGVLEFRHAGEGEPADGLQIGGFA